MVLDGGRIGGDAVRLASIALPVSGGSVSEK